MGWVLYSTKWVKCSALPHDTTQNTTATNNNQHQLPPPYPSEALALSLHSNIRHGPRSWRRCSLWVCSRHGASGALSPLSVPVIGVPEQDAQKNREMQWAMALGGHHLRMKNNNQPNSWWKQQGGYQSGGTCGGGAHGGHCPIVWGGKWSSKKIERWAGPWSQTATNRQHLTHQPTKNRQPQRRGV